MNILIIIKRLSWLITLIGLLLFGGLNSVSAVCDFSTPTRVTDPGIPSGTCVDWPSPASTSTNESVCGSATINHEPNSPLSYGDSVYGCTTDLSGVRTCYCQAYICDTECGGSTGGGTDTCGSGTYPQCNGTCSGGNVCKAIAATGKCNCGPPVSCDQYVPDPNLLTTTRISPTSARFRWSAINTTTYPYVERIALVVEEVGSANFNTCKVAAKNGTASANCNVYQPNLAVTATSYTATGALTAGTKYNVYLLFVTQDPPGILPACTDTDEADYLSSCELTPDPTTVAVGGTRVLTTNLVANTWNVSYTRAPTSYATVTTPDNALPYRTTVGGSADGVVTVTSDVYADATPTTLACSDTAEVTVGCVTSAPVAPTLVSPGNGSTVSTTTVNLDWSATTDWGTGCPSNTNRYRVYVDTTSPPTTERTNTGSGVTAYDFTGSVGNTYYWRVGADNGSLETKSTIRHFTIQDNPPLTYEAWWQVEGAGVYAGSTTGGVTIGSQVPSGNYLLIPGTVGSVAALMRGSGTYDTGDGGLSTSAWNALTKYQGKRVDYAYLAAQLGVTTSTSNDWASDAMDKPVYEATKEFYYLKPATGEAHLSADWSVLTGEKYVVVVDGDLRLDHNVTVANGGFLLWVVSGNITVAPTVAELEGLMLSSGNWITETNGGSDTQLVISGSVVAWGSIELNRNLGGAANASPAERFVYRPDLLFEMPKKVKTFVMQWAEVPAGTLGN